MQLPVMPPLPPSENVYTRNDAIAFQFLGLGGWLLQWTFIIGIALGSARLLVIGALALAQWARSRRRQREDTGGAPQARPALRGGGGTVRNGCG